MSALSTDMAIRKWKPKIDGEAKSVGGRLGLYIRGWTSGAKVFYFRSNTWLKIGEYPSTTLAQARELAIVAKRLRKDGFGNQALQQGFTQSRNGSSFESAVRKTPTEVPHLKNLTYDEVWQDWFADVELTLQEGPSRRRPAAIHEHHIKPVLGDRSINDIRRREVFELLAELFRSKPTTAGHARGHMDKVFERAISLEYCENNPVPPRSVFPKRATRKKHHGTLPAEKLPDLWHHVSSSNAGHTTKLAILTALVTAHRIGVIVTAEWNHLDLDSGIWTVPERADKSSRGRMKSGRSYALRLPDDLVSSLIVLKQNTTSKFVFESPTTAGHVSENAILKQMKSYDETLTTHGLRNAIKEFCRKTEPPIPDHIADAFCDHSLKGLDASYRRMDTSIERAELSNRLLKHVTKGLSDIGLVSNGITG